MLGLLELGFVFWHILSDLGFYELSLLVLLLLLILYLISLNVGYFLYSWGSFRVIFIVFFEGEPFFLELLFTLSMERLTSSQYSCAVAYENLGLRVICGFRYIPIIVLFIINIQSLLIRLWLWMIISVVKSFSFLDLSAPAFSVRCTYVWSPEFLSECVQCRI